MATPLLLSLLSLLLLHRGSPVAAAAVFQDEVRPQPPPRAHAPPGARHPAGWGDELDARRQLRAASARRAPLYVTLTEGSGGSGGAREAAVVAALADGFHAAAGRLLASAASSSSSAPPASTDGGGDAAAGALLAAVSAGGQVTHAPLRE